MVVELTSLVKGERTEDGSNKAKRVGAGKQTRLLEQTGQERIPESNKKTLRIQ